MKRVITVLLVLKWRTFGMSKVERDCPIWPLIVVHHISRCPGVQLLQRFGQRIANGAVETTLERPLKPCYDQETRLAE